MFFFSLKRLGRGQIEKRDMRSTAAARKHLHQQEERKKAKQNKI